MWLKCCQCGKQFEITGELAEQTRAFYDAQPNHTPDKEGGVCDECWEKRGPPIQQTGHKRRWTSFRWSIAVWLLLFAALITSCDVIAVYMLTH
jgi:hypothetical protein